MKTLEQSVKKLFELVTTGNTVQAMKLFYAGDVTMQENEDPPRIGKQFCINHEKKLLENTKDLSIKIMNQAIDALNDVVFTEMEINFISSKGVRLNLKEISIQHWRDDQVVKEKFYYKEFMPQR